MSDLFGRGTMIVAPILQCKGKESAPSLRRKLKKKTFFAVFCRPFLWHFKNLFCGKSQRAQEKMDRSPHPFHGFLDAFFGFDFL
jgi:hypothetical protein